MQNYSKLIEQYNACAAELERYLRELRAQKRRAGFYVIEGEKDV